MEQSLLSELCGTCHAEKSKYRCPRCRAQTCSLLCYKRHQQRASCSGKRDPATYVKKTQLATPVGIDRDYNYLRSVERTVHDASQDVLGRGIGVEPTKSKVATRGWRPDSSLQKYLNENRITIQHAPIGMSRQKTNDTRVTKSGNVVWTMEWASVEGKGRVQHGCLATSSIAKLHAEFQTQTRNAEKRRLNLAKFETVQDGRKRKRAKSENTISHSTDTSELTDSRQNDLDVSASVPSQPDGLTSPATAELGNSHVERRSGPGSLLNPISNDDATQEDMEPLLPADSTHQQQPSSTEHTTTPTIHYYLLKPGTVGVPCVLIPLDARTSLTDALRDQVVQEYPTVYVLAEPAESLPTGYLLEEQYLSTATMKALNNSSHVYAKPQTEGRLSANASAPMERKIPDDELDPSSILAMLKRDIAL